MNSTTYVLYLDECGDPGPYDGTGAGNSRHFILSGIIVPIDGWNECFERLKEFRRGIRAEFGLPLREELHAAELIRINKIESYRKIMKADRIKIFRRFVESIPAMVDCGKIINVCLDKTQQPAGGSIKQIAWARMIQRFDTFLKKHESALRKQVGNATAAVRGIIVADGIEDKEVRMLLRKMRVYNPVPKRYGSGYWDLPTSNIIEDPFARDSKHSYFVQVVDAVAHALYRREYPKGALKKHGVEHYFEALRPILLTEANAADKKYGVVRK